jgi:hypothetical protein
MAHESGQHGGAGQLFDDMIRVDGAPARHAEGSYAFMNRVNQPFWRRVRDQLEAYFRDYPTGHALDVVSRFTDDDPQQHYAAWWELYLFALFSRLGYAVAPHPDVDGATKKPDFLLARGSDQLYVEAAVVFSGIAEDGRNGPREAWIYDLVNKATSPNFNVGLEFDRLGMLRPKDRELIAPLEQWLNNLDPDEVSAAMDNGDEPPELCLPVRDWGLMFTAHPIKPEYRGKPRNRLLGAYPAYGGFVNDQHKLRKTLNKKAGHYGVLDKPFIIAVMGMSPFMDNEDVENALFGNIVYRYSVNEPGDGRWVRNRDGLWMRGTQPRATRVSGVLMGTGVFPWNHTHELPRLWTNPWAAWPLHATEPFPTATSDDTGTVTYTDTPTAARDIFGLPEDWPGPERSFVYTEPEP